MRLSTFIYRLSNFFSLALITALYAFFLINVMPAQSVDSQAYAGDWGAPDGHFYYDADELYRELANWDAAGRADYIDFRLSLDIVWAIAYAGFLMILISIALRSAYPANDRRRLWNLAPLLPMFCDYLENALGIVLVANHGLRLDILANFASAVTALKWISLVAAHAVLLFALAAAALSLRREQQ